jgi:hypothetical protein
MVKEAESHARRPQASCVRRARNKAANGRARPARIASPLSSAGDSRTGHEWFVHLAGRPSKRR